MKVKRLLLPLVMVIVMMAMCPQKMWAQSSYSGSGTGIAGDPYLINTAKQLAEFRDLVNTSVVVGTETTYPNANACAKLINNINLSKLEGNWIPIGTGAIYTGTFDGQGHSITGMSILNYTTGNQGFFGSTGEGSNIKNFTLSGEMTSSTSGLSNIGAVVAAAGYKTNISDVTSNVTITLTEGTTQNYIAGIAGGRTSRTTLTRCVNNGNIDAGASTNCIAGMMSFVSSYGSTKYCLNTGNITTTGNNAYIAGMVAYQNDADSRFNGSHQCLNTGKITAGSDKYAGAIYGWYRHHANQVGDNNYYLSTSATKAVGENSTTDDLTDVCTSLTAEQIRCGEACYLLNLSKSTGTLNWHQTIGSDNTPQPNTTGSTVYQVNCTYCDGTSTGTTYSNTNEAVTGNHLFAQNDPTRAECTLCHHGFFRYSSKEAVSPYAIGELRDKDRDILEIMNNNYVTSEGKWVMEFNKPLVTIGDYAFNRCSGFMGSFVIPSSVTTIGVGAFNRCSGFTGVLNIPNSVKSIGYQAFNYCNGFSGNLNIPSSVISISGSAFSACNFTSITVDTGNTVYDSRNNCNAIISKSSNCLVAGCKNTSFPNSITAIGDGAFDYCFGLTGTLIIPASVTSIGNNAFRKCTGLTGPLTIPASVTSIGDYAFYNCTGLTGSLTIPNSVISIGHYAFYDCPNFTGSLTIPYSVTFIGEGIVGYTGFTSVEMKSIPQILKYAFDGLNCDKTLVLTDDSYVYTGSNLYFPTLTAKPTYTRSIAATSNWGTVILPFEAKSDDKVQLYELTGVSGSTLTLSPVATVAANTPCIFKKKVANATSVTFTASNVDVADAIATEPATVDGLSIRGTYTAADVTAGAGYMLDADKFVKTTAKTTLSPFRAYLAGAINGVSTLYLPGTFTNGDLNDDGSFTIEDLTLLVQLLNSNGTITNPAADVDGQNGVTVDDVNALGNKILGK